MDEVAEAHCERDRDRERAEGDTGCAPRAEGPLGLGLAQGADDEEPEEHEASGDENTDERLLEDELDLERPLEDGQAGLRERASEGLPPKERKQGLGGLRRFHEAVLEQDRPDGRAARREQDTDERRRTPAANRR